MTSPEEKTEKIDKTEKTEMNEKIVVFVMAPNKEDLPARLARALVEERLAACANLIPSIRSIYSWKGEICDDQEVMLVIKTRAALFEDLARRVRELHPYEVPEIIALPIVAGDAPFLAWISETTGA